MRFCMMLASQLVKTIEFLSKSTSFSILVQNFFKVAEAREGVIWKANTMSAERRILGYAAVYLQLITLFFFSSYGI